MHKALGASVAVWLGNSHSDRDDRDLFEEWLVSMDLARVRAILNSSRDSMTFAAPEMQQEKWDELESDLVQYIEECEQEAMGMQSQANVVRDDAARKAC